MMADFLGLALGLVSAAALLLGVGVLFFAHASARAANAEEVGALSSFATSHFVLAIATGGASVWLLS